jgi:hypothetical protein
VGTQDAERTGVAPFTRSGGRWREVSGMPTVPSLPARRAARFPKPRCNQPECHPPEWPPPVCLPEECPPPKCPPAEWPPPPPCCASAGASRHIAATQTKIMRVGRTRKAIRLTMAFPIPRESISSLLLSRARKTTAQTLRDSDKQAGIHSEMKLRTQDPSPLSHRGYDPPNRLAGSASRSEHTLGTRMPCEGPPLLVANA